MASARSPQRRARRRAEILDAARRLFEAEGVGPVTIGRIARESGIGPGNLYYWFPSKEELVRALFREWVDESRIAAAIPDDPAVILAVL
ncbi:MAG: helix-turn-helix domain-containing protein [Protaetiibacter sp.]